MRINVNLRPSGGYVFREKDASMHRSNSWPAVIQKVREYRGRMGHTVGDVDAEVMAQACERYPTLCGAIAHSIPPSGVGRARGGPRPPVIVQPAPPRRVNGAPLKGRVLLWLTELFTRRQRREPIAFVSAQEAAARESICAGCPRNTEMEGSGCSSCKKALSDYRESVITNKTRYDRLHGCSILGIDLVTAVHLDEVRIDNPALPANCWRKIAV